jgi:hypothetical protein
VHHGDSVFRLLFHDDFSRFAQILGAMFANTFVEPLHYRRG